MILNNASFNMATDNGEVLAVNNDNGFGRAGGLGRSACYYPIPEGFLGYFTASKPLYLQKCWRGSCSPFSNRLGCKQLNLEILDMQI
jgi:hypothetical protein